ncbi:hypothetical protein V462_23470 [Pantoea ananatis 15320]|nr:hypothetical protein V462_23470 [Pantoea ananatis 15320]
MSGAHVSRELVGIKCGNLRLELDIQRALNSIQRRRQAKGLRLPQRPLATIFNQAG